MGGCLGYDSAGWAHSIASQEVIQIVEAQLALIAVVLERERVERGRREGAEGDRH